MAVWKVRGGDDSEAEDIALDEGVIAVRFHEIPEDLLDSQTPQDMKRRAQATNLTIPPSDIDQLCHFRTSIEIGDLVIMPCRKGSNSWQTLAVGEVVGEYEYHAELPTYRHRREIIWINTAVPKTSIDEDLRDFISAPGTIRKPSDPYAEQRFRHIADSAQNETRWDDYVRRAREYFNAGLLDSVEVNYKIETGHKLATARDVVLFGTDEWGGRVKWAISGNLIFPVEQAKFRDWIDESPEDSLTTLRALWTNESSSVVNRIRDFCNLLPRSASSGRGVRTTVASVLMMGLDAQQYPPFQVTVFDQAYQRLGYARPEHTADEATLYQHALNFLDRFIDEASKRDLLLRHRLDAQSLVWRIYSDSRLEQDQLPPCDDQEPEPPDLSTDPWSQSNIATLAQELLWQSNHLQEIIDDLQEKHQVIFYGPPGTGKTYVAREIAKQCQLNGGDFEIVQFHPSYSYEDFVEGYRPTLTDVGQPAFKLVQGPLRRIADKARKNKEATFILIIDELNRGNVAKVFGELYFLLEYRDEEVRLQYGGEGEGFSLPSNLWFICTMNTADRSIALMDAALRRRFYFVPFFPNEPPIEGLLRRWLDREDQNTLAADLVDEANKKLDRDMGIGPSYFMRPDQTLDESRVSRIWDRAIIPYIEEQFFGDADKLAEFRFDRLKRQLDGSVFSGDMSNSETDTAQADDADPNAT